MAFNLFVAYDLITPGQNYETVQQRIKELGRWHKLQFSLFYVHTHLDSQAVHAHVSTALDANDKLAVIDASLVVLSPDVSDSTIATLNQVWSSDRAALSNYQASAYG